MGQSGSGKSAVTKRLCYDDRFSKVQTLTSRPKRYREGNSDYKFTNNIDFVKLQEKKGLIGVREYNTLITGEKKIFRYGIETNSLERSMRLHDHSVIITDLDGFYDLADAYGPDNVIGFYLDVPYSTLASRAGKRKDFNKEEHVRRYNNDIKTMSPEVIDKVSRLYCIYVLDGTQTIGEVSHEIKAITLERIENIKTD